MHITRFLTGIVIAVVLSAGSGIAGPFEDCAAAHKRQKYAQALRRCRPLAEQGNADAQHNLGFMYMHGYGVAQDYAEAVTWYRKAADQGDDAQSNLSTMHAQGLSSQRAPTAHHY